MSQIDTENDKNQKFPVFEIFMHFFQVYVVKDWNNQKRSTRKACVVQCAYIWDKGSFSNENGPELTSKKTKTQKFTDFPHFVQILSNYR